MITAGMAHGEIRSNLSRTDDLIALSGADSVLQLVAFQVASEAHWCVGNNPLALQQLQNAERIYRHQDRNKYLAYGKEFQIFLLMWRAMVKFAMGYPTQSQAFVEELLCHCVELDNPGARGFALHFESVTSMMKGDIQRAIAILKDTERHNETEAYPAFLDWADVSRGWIALAEGDPETGMASIANYFSSMGLPLYWEPWIRSYYPAALARAGAGQSAIDEADKNIAFCEQAEMDQFLSLCWLAKADALCIARLDASDAEQSYRKAIDIARGQQARMWELRAVSGLARLWHSQGKTPEARNLLAPVYGWFTEGFDSADLKEAKALLDELG